AVADAQGDGAAEGASVPDAPDDLQLVGLEGHPCSPAVAESAAGERRLDVVTGHLDPGREAVEGRDECRAVGLTGGQPTKHAPILSSPPEGPTSPSLLTATAPRTPRAAGTGRTRSGSASPVSPAPGPGRRPRRGPCRRTPRRTWPPHPAGRGRRPRRRRA